MKHPKHLLFWGLIWTFNLWVLDQFAGFLRPFLDRPEVVPRAIGRPDPELGWSFKPNSSAESSVTGERVVYRINSKGARDDETTYERAHGHLRAVLLGDSHTFGFGIPIEEHFSRLLENDFENLETINLGVNGFGVDQQLLMLRKEGLHYHPDLVLAYVPLYGKTNEGEERIGRHMRRSSFGASKPLFRLVDGELRLEENPVPKDRSVLEKVFFPNLVPFAKAVLDTHLYRRISPSQLFHGNPPNPMKGPDSDEALHELAAALIRQMELETKQAGARFLLVTKIDRLHRDATSLGIDSLNLADGMRPQEYKLPRGLGHMNRKGNRVFADLLAPKLKELLPALRPR